MDWITQNYDVVMDVVTTVIAAAAEIAAIVPAGANAGKIIATIRKVVDLLALNVGNAKNAK